MRDQRAAWRATLTGSWWWRAQCSAITEGRPKVVWGVSAGTKGRRAVYAHLVHWVWLCWTTRAGRATLVRTVAGWKCRAVSRDATLVTVKPAGLAVCPKCLLAEASQDSLDELRERLLGQLPLSVPDQVHSR